MFLMGIHQLARAEAPESVPGEFLIKSRAGVSRDEFASRLTEYGARELRRLPGSLGDVAVYRIEHAGLTESLLLSLSRDPSVEYVQPNYILTTGAAEGRNVEGLPVGCLLTPDSVAHCPRIFPLTGASKPSLEPRPDEVSPPVADPKMKDIYSLAITRAHEAWSIFRGSSDMVVGVVDSGIDYNHPDLAFNMWRNPAPGPKQDIVGYDSLTDDGSPFDDDVMKGHGTHAAGIIGAVGGNGVGISGVNQRVSLMALKAFSAFGYGTSESVVAAIGYAIDHGAKIVSNSWASGKKDHPAVIDIIERARAKGVLLFFAAGNSAGDNDRDETANYPAAYKIDNIVAVASTDSSDQLASSSNYGATTVLLAAPGVNIYSTMPKASEQGSYGWESGTSMACPFAAGVAAMIWAKNPSWSYKEVRSALAASVDVVPGLAGKVVTSGRVNVLKAMQFALP